MIYSAGSLLFIWGSDPVGSAIDWFETIRGDKPALASHAAVITKGGTYTQALVTEALSRVLCHPMLTAYPIGDVVERLCCYEPVNVPPEALQHGLKAVASFRGDMYGWWKLGLCAIDSLISKLAGKDVVWARHLARNGKYPICSRIDAVLMVDIGRGDGIDPRSAEPEEERAYCEAHPGQWRVVHGWLSPAEIAQMFGAG